MLRVGGVFKVVALRGSTGHHGVDVQHPPNQAFQLIQLVKLKVCCLLFKGSGTVETMRRKISIFYNKKLYFYRQRATVLHVLTYYELDYLT